MIFGTSAPKFIFNPLGTNETVLLDYVVVVKDEPEQKRIMHQSIFTGHREFIVLKKYWLFELKMHLYKYTTAVDGKTPQEKYDELKQYEGLNVRLYRHADGDYIKQPDATEASFFLETIDESYYQTTDYKDLLLLKFRSNSYTDFSQGL